MKFNEYSDIVRPLARYPDRGNNLAYPIVGCGGEAGENLENLKKMWRDDGGELTKARHNAMLKELGDVLWYIDAAAFELGATLEEVALINIGKLLDRNERGVLHGDGDDR